MPYQAGARALIFVTVAQHLPGENNNMKWLDRIPLPILAIVTLPLALAPFRPPHLYEKLQMLAAGSLTHPTDIFDLLLHGIPAVVLIIKLVRVAQQRKAKTASN